MHTNDFLIRLLKIKVLIIKRRLFKKGYNMYKAIIVICTILVLAACNVLGSYYEPEPVGIGKDVYELKLSPCACIEVELPKTLPDWFKMMS